LDPSVRRAGRCVSSDDARFSDCYRHVRNPRSCPTRRSSDLVRRRTRAAGLQTCGVCPWLSRGRDRMAFSVWDGLTEQEVTPSVWSGSEELPATAYAMPLGYSSAASMINQPPPLYVAHRGGSGDWPEESMRAYTNAVAWGAGALEVSANRTSDGVWVCVHDADLTRTSPGAPSVPVAEMTWAEVQQYANQGEPYARLEEVLEAYGQSHVLMLDPKYGGWDMDGFLGLILDYMPADRAVIKFFYTATDVALAAHARGLLTWGYYY